MLLLLLSGDPMIVDVPFGKVARQVAQMREVYDAEKFADQIAVELDRHPDTRGLFNVPVGRLMFENGSHNGDWQDQADLFAALYEGGCYVELVTGHRRTEALRVLGERHSQKYPEKLQVDIRHLDDVTALSMLWKDNEQMAQPRPIEKAKTMLAIMEKASIDSYAGLARFLGVSEYTVHKYVKMAIAERDMTPKQQATLLKQTSLAAAMKYVSVVLYGKNGKYQKGEEVVPEPDRVRGELRKFMNTLIGETERALMDACQGDPKCAEKVQKGIRIARQKQTLLLEDVERLFGKIK